MATYECEKCGMSVNATCGKCDSALENDTLELDGGREVQISKCPNSRLGIVQYYIGSVKEHEHYRQGPLSNKKGRGKCVQSSGTPTRAVKQKRIGPVCPINEEAGRSQ